MPDSQTGSRLRANRAGPSLSGRLRQARLRGLAFRRRLHRFSDSSERTGNAKKVFSFFYIYCYFSVSNWLLRRLGKASTVAGGHPRVHIYIYIHILYIYIYIPYTIYIYIYIYIYVYSTENLPRELQSHPLSPRSAHPKPAFFRLISFCRCSLGTFFARFIWYQSFSCYCCFIVLSYNCLLFVFSRLKSTPLCASETTRKVIVWFNTTQERCNITCKRVYQAL